MTSSEKTTSQPNGTEKSTAPSISLPKGGGAIRGIGEKFAANPVTGTGSMTVPISTSPGRSGFGPQLALSYDSGVGNGPFGLGWNQSLPAITRKTDKGLPQYRDADESDVFLLSGAEDLVPVLKQDGNRFEDDITVPEYTIHRYRPRIEGLFARLERWTRQSDGDVHWRSISKDNILTLYGKDADSRIADPEDSRRIFSWLICETRDDKGNAVLYEYKPEDGIGVNLTCAHERNRGDHNDPRRTANRYLKHIHYGNRTPMLNSAGQRPRFLTEAQIKKAGWLFEVVFDYGEHDANTPKPDSAGQWAYREDPFSTYRSGFEVRTTRLCHRVLMFHHFAGEKDVGNDCLVRSTNFLYSHEQDLDNARNPVYTVLRAVTQNGYKRNGDRYLKRSLPPVEFEYTQPVVQDTLEEVNPSSLENLPIGVNGMAYQWTDLHGEGIPGILAEQGGAWFYKRNISPMGKHPVEFAPLERVNVKPNLALARGAQFMDLAGDGQPDLVVLDGSTPGLYEHDGNESWQSFRPFTSSLNRDIRDPNLKFVDLNGDGHADVLISENDDFVQHCSLAEAGFGPARRITQALDEEQGPRLIFADGTQSISLADLSGDGLTDLVRIRNGEICYWPNLGYGRFGAKITMDSAPYFDHPDQFDHQRIRMADIDGTGTTDIIYLHRDGVRLYFNQSGNSWSTPQILRIFPNLDDIVSITLADLLGNGTACLVWSSPLPGDNRRPMRYVNLMGGQKPHLLVKTVNNLGAETHVHYAPSTKFYLLDKYDGKPWITRLPFPVHVVERVETYDRISRNRFITRYAYHHGYFDGIEREFRGFGMVEQWDTEEFASLTQSQYFPTGDNIEKSSHVPPVLTRTWFHTGAYFGRLHISNFFAGLLNGSDIGEYYREPGLTDKQARELLLQDTILPDNLTAEEEREACRALKGAMLRQEVYALDGTDKEPYPYTVTEQNFTIRCLQARTDNRHGVFFTHAREAVNYHYERNTPADPRITHAMTLEVDDFGNVLKETAISYGRRPGCSPLSGDDKKKQEQLLVIYTENSVTHAIDGIVDDYRTPLPCEMRTYELTGFTPEKKGARFSFDKWTSNDFALLTSAVEIPYEQTADKAEKQKRLIEHVRTRYRKDDLTALLPLSEVESLALPGESYQLAFTPELAKQIYVDSGKLTAVELDNLLAGEGNYVHSKGDANWWVPSGQIFYSPNKTDTAVQELAHAGQHFFLPCRFRDPFGQTTTISYDSYDLLIRETRDAVNNRTTAGERNPTGNLVKSGTDYRVLQPTLVMGPNRNRTAVAFDALGMVVGTAVLGKPEEKLGDSMDGFKPDLLKTTVSAHLQKPLTDPHALLQRTTTRLVYDLYAYQRTLAKSQPQPAVVYTLVRENHDADLEFGDQTKIQHSFSYSDGFGREIQQKIQAEPEKINGIAGPPRWVGSGWTIFNNKGKPVRRYEPFFENTHEFRFGKKVGVSPVLFYDPVGRVVATLHPNHTYEKVVFDPWQQINYDVNDTVAANGTQTGDPRTDPDIAGYVGTYFKTQPSTWQSWHAQRNGKPVNDPKFTAAKKAAAHADTPTVVHLDVLGRSFLTLADNGPDPAHAGQHLHFATRIELDIEGNQRAVVDAKDRVVMRYDYDMLGNRMHQASMEAGERWILNDVTGNPIRAWDSRNHQFKTEYDPLRRPLRSFVIGADPANPNLELLMERFVYGEQHPEAELYNLRGALYLHLDQAGAVTSEANDFKGNPLRASRRIASEYKQVINWKAVNAALPANAKTPFVPVTLEAALALLVEAKEKAYTSRTTYDAFNRPVTLTTPHTPAMQPSIIRPGYNEANLLESVDANLHSAIAGGLPVWTPFVTNIDYDAKGQRQRIDYGNGVSTFYNYDPLTSRLVHLLTRRNGVAYPGDSPQPSPAGWPGSQVQNLHYTYDPVGNITHIRDNTQQAIFFNNQRVEPSAEYSYDAIYRLIEAKGREHLGQTAGNTLPPKPASHTDSPRIGLLHPSDDKAMGRYIQQYVYDEVGNFLEMNHQGITPVHPAQPGWKRSYSYHEPSLLEPGKQNNRLTSTQIGSAPVQHYTHDKHGNMNMPHLSVMRWDFQDQLRATAQQVVNSGTPETTYYVYDADGERMRKVTERQSASGQMPTRKKERIYLGGFEIYREYEGNGTTVSLERETLHLMEDEQRIALVETRTQGVDSSSKQLLRYQLGNHLGSANVEVDEQARIISYEEYYPFGSTSYQAANKTIKAAAKRYRYTGKERDEESGFYYHGARYYAAWLGRWILPDPAELTDDNNVYLFVRNNPTVFIDPSGTQTSKSPAWQREMAYRIGYSWGKAGRDILHAQRTEPMSLGATLRALDSLGGAIGTTGMGIIYTGGRRTSESVQDLVGMLPPQLDELAIAAQSTGVPQGLASAGALRILSAGLRLLSSSRKVRQLSVTVYKTMQSIGGRARSTLRKSQPVREIQSGAKTAEIAYVKGQKLKIVTNPKEIEMYRDARLIQKEIFETKLHGGKSVYDIGEATHVTPQVSGPGVKATLHTHQKSRMALFSQGDVPYYRQTSYPGYTKHRVIGEKWPFTNELLESHGMSPDPTLIKVSARQTTIKQCRVRNVWLDVQKVKKAIMEK